MYSNVLFCDEELSRSLKPSLETQTEAGNPGLRLRGSLLLPCQSLPVFAISYKAGRCIYVAMVCAELGLRPVQMAGAPLMHCADDTVAGQHF